MENKTISLLLNTVYLEFFISLEVKLLEIAFSFPSLKTSRQSSSIEIWIISPKRCEHSECDIVELLNLSVNQYIFKTYSNLQDVLK